MALTVKPPRQPGVLTALRDRAVRLAELATTPLLPADYLDLVHPLRSGAALRGRVESVTRETRDAATLVIRPGADWAGHLPGQYVRLGVDVDGVRQWRTYSITSPHDRPDRCLSITVKAVPGGTVSNHLVHRTRPGTLVHLDQATGEFVLPEQLPGATLFVTAGSGITPVMGMLRSHAAELSDVVLVHSAPTADDVLFGAELREMAARGVLRLVERHTRTDGHLDAATLAELVPDLADRSAWACGPLPLLDLLEAHWAQPGLGTLQVERFRIGTVVTGEGGTVSFGRTGADVETDGSTSILDAAEAAGVLMPSGCRMGICYGCVLPLREGAVRDLRNGELTIAAPGDGVLVQTCVSAPAGPCDIDH